MKKSDHKKEFTDSNYSCPFKGRKCSLGQCTHFNHNSEHYEWDSKINLYDQGRCYAGGSIVELWDSRFTIGPAFKDNPPFWKLYREFRKHGYNPIVPKEKIPYDFEEIFKQIQDGTFDPKILPLKN